MDGNSQHGSGWCPASIPVVISKSCWGLQSVAIHIFGPLLITGLVRWSSVVGARLIHEAAGVTKTCVAVANKNARIVWALLAKNEPYRRAVVWNSSEIANDC